MESHKIQGELKGPKLSVRSKTKHSRGKDRLMRTVRILDSRA